MENTVKLYNNVGFVRLVDSYGDDARIVNGARVSYANETKTVRSNEGLIEYLMQHRHTSPFELVDFTFHIKAPIFVMRQMIRHRTHSVNEISARYSVLKDEFYIPDKLRLQAKDNKQGSLGFLDDTQNEKYKADIHNLYTETYNLYLKLLSAGVARELARTILPVSIFTEFYWKQNLHNLFHFLKLRLDNHAQEEIQVLANGMAQLIQPIVPIAFAAWEKHSNSSISLSLEEIEFFKNYLVSNNFNFPETWSNRKKQETTEKLKKLTMTSST